MTRSPLRFALALAATLALSFLPLLSLPAAAAPTQAVRSHLSPPPPPPANGKTYFYCNFQGNWIRLKHVPTVAVGRFKDALVVGKCQNLRTNDKYYNRLVGKNINVFYAPKEYPGQFVVYNGRQGRQPVLVTLTFPIPGAPSSTLSGTVTDSASGAAIAGATVSAQQCVSTPTEHCTIHTIVTDAKGKYSIQFFQFGKWKISATATGYTPGGSVTVTVSSGKNSTLNLALVHLPTTVTLTLGVTPTPLSVNGTATVSVTLSQPVDDGLVTFTSSGTATGTFSPTTCTPTAGVCTVNWTPTTAGTATITASWSGNALFQPASNTASVTVNALSTTLSLSAQPSTVTAGQPVTLTAALGASVSGGTVTFAGTGPANATFAAASCTPAAGKCQTTWQASLPGTWQITAQWSGAGGYGPATDTTTVVVNSNASATMTLSANPTSPPVGQATLITPTLSVPASDGLITVTGTGPGGAVFPKQTCVPSGGTCPSGAPITWTPSATGTWTLNATWSGDTQYPAGAQASLLVSVVSAGPSPTISLTATPNPAQPNSSVTLKATLTQPVNDGKVLFSGLGPNGATPTLSQPSCTPSGGTCSVTFTPTATGQWTISAFWSGDNVYPSPVAASVQITVSSTVATVSVSANPNPVTVNHQTTLTAQLATGATGGTITFSGTGPSGQSLTSSPTQCPPNASGSCTAHWIPPTGSNGTWTVRATWTPPAGSQYQTTTGSTTVTVNLPGFLTVSESPNPLTVNQTGTITATVQQPSTGTVTITATGPNGQGYSGSCTLNNSMSCTSSPNFTPGVAGTWTISAFFSNSSGNFQDSTQVSVTGTTTTLTLTSNPTTPNVSQSTSLIATVSPAVSDGSVVFSGAGPNGQAFTPSQNNCVPSGGTCSVTWFPPAAGSWSISAQWGGDATYSQSPVQTIVVNVGSTNNGTLTVSTTPPTPTASNSASLTATLAFNASASSVVTFSGSGPNSEDLASFLSSTQCTIPTGSRSCSVTWTPDASGSWTVDAQWAGDGVHAATSTSATINVGQQPFMTVLLSPASPNLGDQVTPYATLTDTTVNDGEVTFTIVRPDGTTVTPSILCSPFTGGYCVPSDTFTVNEAGVWTVQAHADQMSNYPGQSFDTTISFTVPSQ